MYVSNNKCSWIDFKPESLVSVHIQVMRIKCWCYEWRRNVFLISSSQHSLKGEHYSFTYVLVSNEISSQSMHNVDSVLAVQW